MKVNIGFAQYVATIEFKPFLGDDIEKYREAFEKWYFEEEKTEEGIVIKERSDLHYDCFNTQVIIDWLLEVSPKCGAKIIEPFLKSGQEDKSLPYMCF